MNNVKANISIKEILFILLAIVSILPFTSPALALFLGLAFALSFGSVFAKQAKKTSKYLLQASVVGLGFGMNLIDSLKSGKEGMLFTIISVVVVMVLGYLIGKALKIKTKTSYLISAGTAICGGSAIAAVAPVVKANDDEISVSLGTIFILNAIALFIFPPIGRMLGFDQVQFGEWAAIAIHDTSSVVGAGAAYGDIALQTATLIKCTRALWIIPLALVTTLIFKEKNAKISIPWFIFLFVIAMCLNTYSSLISDELSSTIVFLSKRAMALTLFLIGSGLSLSTIKTVGPKPLVQGIIIWFIIATISSITIMFM